jgi:hypothetical protein
MPHWAYQISVIRFAQVVLTMYPPEWTEVILVLEYPDRALLERDERSASTLADHRLVSRSRKSIPLALEEVHRKARLTEAFP